MNTQLSLQQIEAATKQAEFHLGSGEVFQGKDLPLELLSEIDLVDMSPEDIADIVIEKVTSFTAYCVESHSLFLCSHNDSQKNTEQSK